MISSKNPITVVLAEDQGILRSSLTVMLGIEPDIQVMASAGNGTEALRAVGLHRPAVLVTDIEMPQLTGLDLAARVKELYPATRVFILTTFARPGYLRRALDAGAFGYLLKDCPSTEMAEAVRRVANESSIQAWPPSHGLPLPVRSPSESAKFCDVQVKAKARLNSPERSGLPKERYATTYPKPSQNWARTTEQKRRGSPEPKAGSN